MFAVRLRRWFEALRLNQERQRTCLAVQSPLYCHASWQLLQLDVMLLPAAPLHYA